MPVHISGMDLSVVVVLPSLLSTSTLVLIVPTGIFRKISYCNCSLLSLRKLTLFLQQYIVHYEYNSVVQ